MNISNQLELHNHLFFNVFVWTCGHVPSYVCLCVCLCVYLCVRRVASLSVSPEAQWSPGEDNSH